MMHIFEFYEETFPDQSSLKTNSQSSLDMTHTNTLEKHQKHSVVKASMKNRGSLESDMTTPTDVETPDKDIFLEHNLKPKMADGKTRKFG
jgi:hypothetical protein